MKGINTVKKVDSKLFKKYKFYIIAQTDNTKNNFM